MSYLFAEMLFLLLVTAVLGVMVGWFANGLLAARRKLSDEKTWRRELRQSEARAGNLKNQLAEAFLVEERLREELSRDEPTAPDGGVDPEKIKTLESELTQRDKKIEILKLQVSQSEAGLASEWQSLNVMKSELAERQQRLEERGKQASTKLRASEENQQQIRLQLRSMKRQGGRLQEELTKSQQARIAERQESAARIAELETQLDEARVAERQESAARIAELETQLDEQETLVALLKVDQERVQPRVEATETAEEPIAVANTAEVTDTAGVEESAPDDLRQIRGIGPVLHRKLNQIGVTSFRQIAAWTDDDITAVASKIGSAPGRIRKGGWVEAARELQG